MKIHIWGLGKPQGLYMKWRLKGTQKSPKNNWKVPKS